MINLYIIIIFIFVHPKKHPKNIFVNYVLEIILKTKKMKMCYIIIKDIHVAINIILNLYHIVLFAI